MKRYLAFLYLLICMLSGYAQESYKIVSKSSYNIRMAPNTDSKVIGSTYNQYYLDVYEIKNGWAKIKYGDSIAYVNSKCLGEKEYVRNIQRQGYKNRPLLGEFVFLLMITMPLILFVCCVKFYRQQSLSGFWYYLRWCVFVLLCVVEAVIIVGGYFEYFSEMILAKYTNVKSTGLLYALAAIIIAIVMTAIIQIKSFFDIMEDFKYNYDVDYNIYWAPIALVVGPILSIVAAMCDAYLILVILIILTLLSQIIFMCMIFVKILKSQNIVLALFCTITYLIGVIATIVMASFLFFVYCLIKVSKQFTSMMLTSIPTQYPYNY